MAPVVMKTLANETKTLTTVIRIEISTKILDAPDITVKIS